MQQRPNTIEGTKRSGRTAVKAPVEEAITQQGERSGGNRNNCVIESDAIKAGSAARGLHVACGQMLASIATRRKASILYWGMLSGSVRVSCRELRE